MQDLKPRSATAGARMLVEEAERYLALVDLYRAEGCEPNWRPEPPLVARRRNERRTR